MIQQIVWTGTSFSAVQMRNFTRLTTVDMQSVTVLWMTYVNTLQRKPQWHTRMVCFQKLLDVSIWYLSDWRVTYLHRHVHIDYADTSVAVRTLCAHGAKRTICRHHSPTIEIALAGEILYVQVGRGSQKGLLRKSQVATRNGFLPKTCFTCAT